MEQRREGRETVEIEAPEEPTKLVDLMAALQASVNAATASRTGKPVSVAEAKKQRAAKDATPDKADKVPKATKPAARATKGETDEERPARRRKSA